MQVSHRFAPESALFDDDNLVSCAGLVPVMTLATQTGLPGLLTDKVRIASSRVKSGTASPAPKLGTLIASMCAGSDCIDDVDIVRSGGMKALFGSVYAPSTIGTLLREFTFGHTKQLESVLRNHLTQLVERASLLAGGDARAFIDIDSLLRPVYGHAKQGASYGHTKLAGEQILRKGLSPLATTISTDLAAPVIAGMRLRARQSGLRQGCGEPDRSSRCHRPCTAGNGRREYYGVRRSRLLTAVDGRLNGKDLGGMAPLHPPVQFGFASAPKTLQIVALTTLIDLPPNDAACG